MLPMRLVRFAVALVTLLGFVMPAAADDVTFAGLVTYRERIALPADAVLAVTLVSLPGQHRVAGARADLGGKAGSPISFSLNVRSHVVAAGGRFGLLAEISSGGNVIFRTGQPVLVDAAEPEGNIIEVTFTPPPPHDPPDQVLPPADTPNPLIDVPWTVTSIGAEPTLPGSEVTFSIAADYRAGGNSGCNNYFTEAGFAGSPLSFGPIAGTRMACATEIMEQEQRFFAALGATVGYELAGDTLKLFDAAGVPLVGLIRQD